MPDTGSRHSGAGEDTTERQRRMYRIAYPLRTLGMGLGALPVAVVLYQRDAGLAAWAWTVFCGLLWPHVAYQLARRSKTPYTTELRNFIIDSALAASLVPLLHFNLLPSAMLLTVVFADKINTGVRGLWRRSLLPMFAALAVSAGLNGFQFAPTTDMPTLIASLPMVIIHTLAVSASSYQLIRRVQQRNVRLDEISRHDSLTGLQSRWHFLEMANAVLDAHRAGQPASLLLVDLDQFKDINDRHGHATGDDLLRSVAASIRAALPLGAHAGRLGGDELAIVMPLMPHDAAIVAEHIRSAVQALALPELPELRTSVSIGIAQPSARDNDLRAWMEAADRALYRAKDAGRNRIDIEPA